ncbi:MAG: LysR family transcriptional regulator [Brevundimonas sp.]|uniref:LysR family transcriptional regulator n=1 Tax=Brevundimonas sp. TaxID=1871086 RepID=UPI00258BEE6A|nr:LysR family transcriptional regulator [Brevundimonas sp.]MCV0415106.1 LysR family transcriptional regulator [Brevundimonas sp.]
MNFRHLRYFVAASEHGSFRKAGAALGVQESTISRRIRDMEDGLGSALFHRHSGGVCLTVAGQRLLSKARQVLRHVNEGAEIVDAVGRATEGHLRVGIFSSLASGFLQDLLRRFAEEHPGVRLEVADGNPAEHVAAVREFRLDIAFLTGTLEWPRCETAYLWSERVFVVLPQAHALAEKEEVRWQDLAHETFIVSDVPPGQEIHDYLVQRVADLGHHPKIQLQFVGRDNLLTLVAIGSGLTVMSEAATAAYVPGICYRPIVGEVLPFNGVWSPKNDNPALRRFISTAKTMARHRGVEL